MRILETAGCILMFLGMASMDSESLVIPFAMMFTGIAVMILAEKKVSR